VALLAARAGADMTVSTSRPRWSTRRGASPVQPGLAVQFDVAEAERLPYPDKSLDVSSALGVVFARALALRG
jgi:hypothetical protein